MAHPRTNLGPLTTTFTQPPACTYAVVGCTTCNNNIWSAQTCAPTGPHDDPSCWPSTSEGVSRPPDTLSGWGFYSPGVVCPSGFASACSATAGGNKDWSVMFELEPGETAVGCCPRGYKCHVYTGVQTCLTVPTSTIIPTVTCSRGTSAAFGQMTIPNLSMPGKVTLYAPMIQINWQSSDQPVTSTSLTTSTMSAPLPAPTSIDVGTGDSRGISIGAIVGIVLGVVIAVVVIAMSALFWRWRRRRTAPALSALNASHESEEHHAMRAVIHEMPSKAIPPVELPVSR